MSLPWEDTRTDADGRFSLARPADVVRFSRDGYQPRTKLTADANGTITLSPTRERGWSPSVCSGSQAHRFGNVMQFTAPARTTLDQVVDDDYRLTQVRYRGTALTFGAGPHLTYGLPSKAMLPTIIYERDVRMPWGGEAAECRGRHPDGTVWRAVLMFGESMAYAHADATAAKYFDGMIDTLCFKASSQSPHDRTRTPELSNRAIRVRRLVRSDLGLA